jgi:hypothetical protein
MLMCLVIKKRRKAGFKAMDSAIPLLRGVCQRAYRPTHPRHNTFQRAPSQEGSQNNTSF